MSATNPKFRAKTGRSTTRPVSRVWMFSHECAGLAQVGGLGEAVAGLSKTLAMDSKLNVSVFLPSHGRHLDPRMREAYGLQDLTTFMAQGHRTDRKSTRLNSSHVAISYAVFCLKKKKKKKDVRV